MGILHRLLQRFGQAWSALVRRFISLRLWLKLVLASGLVLILAGGVGLAVFETPREAVSPSPTPAAKSGIKDSAEQVSVPAPAEDQNQPSNSMQQSQQTTSGLPAVVPPSAVSTGCALPKYPDASCTGVPPGTALTIVNGDVTITVAGTVLSGKDIRGCVIVQAANVTIRASKITCSSFYAIASYAASDHGGLVVEDVEIDCGNHNTTGISYQGLIARRVHIHGCENGLDITRDVTLVDSYIHDIYEGASGHGDGIQGSDGSNSTISHNTIYAGSSTAAINLNNTASGPTTANVTISDNLLAGGAYTLYCPIPPTSNFKILNNRFSTLFYPTIGAYGAATDCGGENQSGNVAHQSGAALSL